MDYYVSTPEEGMVLGRVIGPKGPSIWVENAPRDVPSEDVEKLLHDIAWSRLGLRIPRGDSLHHVAIGFHKILEQALTAGVEFPPSIVASLARAEEERKKSLI